MAETSSFSSFKTAFTQLNKKDIRTDHKRSTLLYAQESEPESQLASLTSLFPFLFHGSLLQNPSLSDTCLHSVRILLGMSLCSSLWVILARMWTLSTTSSRTWIQDTYCQQLTLPTVIHIGAQYFSRARAQCPLVISSLRRGESISHGQMFTLQVQERTKCSWGKVLQVNRIMRALLNLVHPDYSQQLLRVVCSHRTDYTRSELRKAHTIPSTRSVFEAENCQWGVKYLINKAGSGQRHSVV